MASYRFKAAEIEAMKQNILTHIEHETENKTAWRLRCAIEGQLMCCRPSKREAARLERELALYENLTNNDLPNWQSEPTQPATPTETPQISTETAKAANVSAESEIEAERAEYKPYSTRAEVIALLKDEHGIEYDAGEVVYLKDGCVAEDLSDEGQWRIYLDADSDKCIDVIAIEPPQSPETPQTVECADVSDYRVCSHCGKHFHEGYYLGDEYACSEECAVALYGGDREQFEADLEMEETEPGTTECYWSVW